MGQRLKSRHTHEEFIINSSIQMHYESNLSACINLFYLTKPWLSINMDQNVNNLHHFCWRNFYSLFCLIVCEINTHSWMQTCIRQTACNVDWPSTRLNVFGLITYGVPSSKICCRSSLRTFCHLTLITAQNWVTMSASAAVLQLQTSLSFCFKISRWIRVWTSERSA